MSIKNILSFAVVGTIASITFGARIYQLLQSNETPTETYTRNRMVGSTLSNARRSMNEPSTSNIASMLLPAGITLLNAYSAYSSRHTQAPSHISTRNTTRPGPVTQTAAMRVVEEQNPFEKRLNDAKFSLDDIPEEFIDPISYRIMADPIVATTSCKNNKGETITTRHFYDKSTYEKLKGICPENRLKFLSCKPDNALKSQIENFVKQQEKEKDQSKKKSSIKR